MCTIPKDLTVDTCSAVCDYLEKAKYIEVTKSLKDLVENQKASKLER